MSSGYTTTSSSESSDSSTATYSIIFTIVICFAVPAYLYYKCRKRSGVNEEADVHVTEIATSNYTNEYANGNAGQAATPVQINTSTPVPTQPTVVYVVPNQTTTPVRTQQPQPSSFQYKKTQEQTQPKLPQGWRKASTADGRFYYQNDVTKQTQWDVPTAEANTVPIKPQKQPRGPAKYAHKEAEEEPGNAMHSFKSELDQLLHVIDRHMKFMTTHEKNVDKIIASSGDHANLLRTAKSTALTTEKEILNEIMNISTMNQFLTDIILVENLFNSKYTADERRQQRNARQQYARNIPNYESKAKPCSEADSFVDLVFYAKSTLGTFKKWLQTLAKECEQQKIRIVSNSGVREKNIERAFYKSFYVYGAVFGEYGYEQMTDVLRCSLVFDDFSDLYGCFGIIEKMMAGEDKGGILRCKDRFHPEDMPFGYRDLLINIHCPGSNQKVVCEVQLHHQVFYQYKAVSHAVYKKARIFEDKNGNNMAYQYSDQNIRKTVGDKLYETGAKDEDPESKAHQLLKEWGLEEYVGVLIDDNGWDDAHDWSHLSEKDLLDMNFKAGHAKKFVRLVKIME